MRKYFPYLNYETFDFKVPTATEGDVFARYRVQVEEMRQSVKICQQALERISPTGRLGVRRPRIVPPPKDRVYTEMEALIQHFLIYSQGFNVPEGEATCRSKARAASTGLHRVGRHQPSVPRQVARAVVHRVPGAAEDGRRRADCRPDRGHRIDGRRDGRCATGELSSRDGLRAAGSTSRRASWRSQRPPFAYTAENRAKLRRDCHALSAGSAQVGDPRRAVSRAAAAGLHHAHAMRHVAEQIGCTPAEVEDVVSYYTMFYTRPVGKYVLKSAARSRARFLGAERVTEELSAKLGIKPGETDASGPSRCWKSSVSAPATARRSSWSTTTGTNGCRPEQCSKLVDDIARAAPPRSPGVI